MNRLSYDGPHGFILSDAALYSYEDQDVYPDILSFCVAIPDHLKPLFLIPIQIEINPFAAIASRMVNCKHGNGLVPPGDTEESDLFSVRTFLYNDNEPLIPKDEPGSIFDMDTGYEKTHHQEYHHDENIQSPTDTSYMSDIDITQYQEYPYRTKEKPVRHSSVRMLYPVIIRLAISPEDLENRTPSKIKENAEICTVQFISFDKRNRVYTFVTVCGGGPHNVRASLSDSKHVAIICDCPFWQWNGPEFHAVQNDYILGDPHGTASPPDIRDPDRKYWLCKHAYAVITRLDHFVQEVIDENPHIAADEAALLDEIDSDWDRLEGVAEIPLERIEELEEEAEVEWEEPEEEVPEGAVPIEPELEEEPREEPEEEPEELKKEPEEEPEEEEEWEEEEWEEEWEEEESEEREPKLPTEI